MLENPKGFLHSVFFGIVRFSPENKKKLNNYRPISALPVISKVFELVVHYRICAFLEMKTKLLSDSQYGYRSKRSTVDAMSSITEKIR